MALGKLIKGNMEDVTERPASIFSDEEEGLARRAQKMSGSNRQMNKETSPLGLGFSYEGRSWGGACRPWNKDNKRGEPCFVCAAKISESCEGQDQK